MNTPHEQVYGYVNGVAITDDIIAELVANAEAGHPGVTARKPGRPLMGEHPARTVAVRLDPDLDHALITRATETDTTTSEIIRDALRHYLQPTN